MRKIAALLLILATTRLLLHHRTPPRHALKAPSATDREVAVRDSTPSTHRVIPRCAVPRRVRARSATHAIHLLLLAAAAVDSHLANTAGRFITEFNALAPDDAIVSSLLIDTAKWRQHARELSPGSPFGGQWWGGCNCRWTPRSDQVDEDGTILAINRKLTTMKIDMEFVDATLDDIVAFVRDFTGMTMLVDAGARDKVDLARHLDFRVRDLVLCDTLLLLCTEMGLEFQITDEKVVFLTARSCEGGYRPVLECPVTVWLRDALATEVLAAIGEKSGVPIWIEDDCLAGKRLMLTISSLSAESAIGLVCDHANVTWRREGGNVIISRP